MSDVKSAKLPKLHASAYPGDGHRGYPSEAVDDGADSAAADSAAEDSAVEDSDPGAGPRNSSDPDCGCAVGEDSGAEDFSCDRPREKGLLRPDFSHVDRRRGDRCHRRPRGCDCAEHSAVDCVEGCVEGCVKGCVEGDSQSHHGQRDHHGLHGCG